MSESSLLVTMRPLFAVKSLFATSTVSLSSLTQSTFKTVYTSVWIVVYLIESVAFLRNVYASVYGNTLEKDNIMDYFAKLCNYVITFYMLFMSLTDYKTFVSSALNIQTATELLELKGIKITPTSRVTFVVIALAIIWKSLMICCYSMFTWILSQNVEAITSYVTVLHFYGSQLLMTVAYATFKFKTNQIYESLNRAQEAIKLQYNCMTFDENINLQNLESNSTLLQSFISKKVRGAMCYIDGQILKHCWPFLAWLVLGVSVSMPVVIYQYLIAPYKTPNYDRSPISIVLFVMYIASNSVFCLALFYSSEEYVEECHVTVATLFEIASRRKGDKRRRYLNHQTLATIHRSSLTSCYLFDLEYSLGMDIVDTAVLVVTTLNG